MTLLRINRGGANALPLGLIAQAIPRLSRSDLEALAERLVDRLDEIDGDPDLEGEPDLEPEDDRCLAGDDGCGPYAMHGVVRWGADADGANRLPRPRYGLDQSQGPINPY